MRFLKWIARSFIESGKDYLRSLKSSWKGALVITLILLVISYITKEPLDIVINYFGIFCVAFGVFALIYCSVRYLYEKKFTRNNK